MLVTFKSRSAADVPMYAENAKLLLSVLGKTLEPESAPRGIIVAAEVPAALEKLRSAADASRRSAKADATRDDESGRPIPVSLAQRAFPLIDMLERAAKDRCDIVWGV